MNLLSRLLSPSPLLVVLISICLGLYQIRIKPLLKLAGVWRTVENIGSRNCITVPELQACEQIILHEATGVLYLACSEPSSRGQWCPSLSQFNAENRSLVDYVATYNPKTKEIQRLKPEGFDTPRGLSLHGMDVVPSSSNHEELFIYLVNHRPPLAGDLRNVDESVEVFRTVVGSKVMTHVHTFEDSAVMTSLNDVVGSNDGKSVYFTNETPSGTLISNLKILIVLGLDDKTIGFCHQERGCKVAIDKMAGNNGIAKSPMNDTYYVANVVFGGVRVLSKQADDRLVLGDEIPTDRPLDNLSVDAKGHVWVAGLPKIYPQISHILDPSVFSPSSAIRISINTGENSYFGEKYKVEKVFEDDGRFVTGTTAVVHDAKRKKLFFHGVSAPYLTICDLEE